MPNSNQIVSELAGILQNFNGKEYSDPIDRDTLFMSDLGFTSIDVVVLGESLESHFGQEISFGDFITELRSQDIQDVQVGALADYLERVL